MSVHVFGCVVCNRGFYVACFPVFHFHESLEVERVKLGDNTRMGEAKVHTLDGMYNELNTHVPTSTERNEVVGSSVDEDDEVQWSSSDAEELAMDGENGSQDEVLPMDGAKESGLDTNDSTLFSFEGNCNEDVGDGAPQIQIVSHSDAFDEEESDGDPFSAFGPTDLADGSLLNSEDANENGDTRAVLV